MRRNLVLLTAVVLAAIVLSGCVMWPFGVAVKYDLEPGVFAAHKNDKRISKNAVDFKAEFMFKNEEETRGFRDFERKVVDKNNDPLVEAEFKDIDKDGKPGIEVTIPAVGKTDITISIRLPKAN